MYIDESFSENIHKGLSEKEVHERVIKGLSNEPVETSTKSVKQIIFENIFTFFNMIFLVLAILLMLVKSFDELSFLLVIFANIGIGITQEIISKKKLDDLSLMAVTKAKVIREGTEIKVSIHDLVKDDLVIFESGNQICADAYIIEGEIQVNEALITGEPDEIAKRKKDPLLSGSFVVSGKCIARLTRVGSESYVSKLTLEAKKSKKKDQPKIMRSLSKLVFIIAIAIFPIGLMLYYRQTEILGLTVKEGVENTTAAIIGMIPEGLYLLVSIAMVVSVGKLALKKTLVQDLKSTETLARVNMLCVDKTGTITESKMKFSETIPLSYDEDDLPCVDIYIDKDGMSEIEKNLSALVNNLPADNQTMEALKNQFNTEARVLNAQRVQTFSSETKYSAVSFGMNNSYILGAPEMILRERYEDYKNISENYMNKGNRVLLFAKCGDELGGNELNNIEPVAFILLMNPIRENAKKTFEYFNDNGVEIKVISGDNPLTVSAAARQAGILNYDKYIDATVLDSDAKIYKAVQRYTIFGRVKPKQKRTIIRALKKHGNTVAMTGDGVNDVLALKEADCSIAMASGSDVASQVSDLVLLNSDFASMPDVVAEGRRVINNVERAASLYLVKNIFSIILAIISITAVIAYPLTPSQLMLMTILTIGIPSTVFAIEPNDNIVKGRFLLNVIYKALPAALTDLIIVVGVIAFQELFYLDSDELSTMTALLITAVGFFMVWNVSKPITWPHAIMFAGLLVALVFIIFVIPEAFSLTALSLKSGLILTVFLFTIPTVYFVLTMLFERMAQFANFCKEKMKL